MITIYELLEVNENASKEEIEKSYSRLILEFRQDPNFDEETNKSNEMISNKLKIAYEILTNDEKRKKYDNDLAQKRAENLIAGVEIKEEKADTLENVEVQENKINSNINQNLNSNVSQKPIREMKAEQVKREVQAQKNTEQENNKEILTDKEKKDIRKAAKKEFEQKLKKVKQAEAEYNEAYNEAYNNYLRKMGYKVEEPWTLKRIKRVVIAILILILTCIIMWNIPPIKQLLIDTYNGNFIIKAIIDLIKIIFGAIASFFK